MTFKESSPLENDEFVCWDLYNWNHLSFTCSHTNVTEQSNTHSTLTWDVVMFSLCVSGWHSSPHRLGSYLMKWTWKLHDTGSLVTDLLASHLKVPLEISLSIASLQELNRKFVLIRKQGKVKEPDYSKQNVARWQ